MAALVSGALAVLYVRLQTPAVGRIAAKPAEQRQTAKPLQNQHSSARPPVTHEEPVKSEVKVANAAVPAPPEVQPDKKKVHPEKHVRPARQNPRRQGKHVVAAQKSAGAKTEEETRQPQQRRAVKADRASIDAYLFAGRSAEERRDYVAALKEYKKANEADPGNYRIYNNLASTSLSLDMNSEALSYANRALVIKPDYTSALINGGIAQIRLGNEAAAKGLFSRAVAVDPLSRPAIYNLALLQERSGSLDEAVISYKKLRDMGEGVGYLGLGGIFESRGQKQDALRVYRDLLAMPDTGQKARDTAKSRISALE